MNARLDIDHVVYSTVKIKTKGTVPTKCLTNYTEHSP
jgi:hypothetical protein